MAGDARELAAVVELQRVELNRLLRENHRLSERLDRLLKLHEQEQALRLQMQKTIDRIAQRPAPGESAPGDATALHARMQQAEGRVERLKIVVERLLRAIEHDRVRP